MAGINGMQKRRKRRIREKKRNIFKKGMDINKVKGSDKGVPRITFMLLERKTLSNIFLFLASAFDYGIINKIIGGL